MDAPSQSQSNIPYRTEAKQIRSEEQVRCALREQYGSDVTLRAADLDNKREVQELNELLALQYMGDRSATVRGPFLPLAHGRSGEHLSHVVAVAGAEILAHIAFRYRWNSGAVEILLPAITAGARRHVANLSDLFWLCLRRQAVRQGWQAVSHLAPTCHPLSQLLGAKCFHATTVAIIPPQHAVHAPLQKYRTSGFLLMQRMFQLSLPPIDKIFAPEPQRQTIVQLLKRLTEGTALSRTAESVPEEPITIPRNHPALLIYSDDTTGLFQLRVRPSALRSTSLLVQELAHLMELSREPGNSGVVCAALDDPLMPEFAVTLNNLGYRFCGVAPFLDGGPYVLYSRFHDSDLKAMNLYTEDAKQLRDEILDVKAEGAVSLP